jgi:hypothetical protein
VGPVVIINDTFQTPKKLDPCPRRPHYMRLYIWWQILNLCHGDCASERGKISLYSSQNPLSLTGWKLSCCYWSPCGGRCGPWPRTSLVPRVIRWSCWHVYRQVCLSLMERLEYAAMAKQGLRKLRRISAEVIRIYVGTQ